MHGARREVRPSISPRSDRAERKKLAEEIQREILENYYFVPVFRHAFMNAIGPRIAADEMAGRVPDRSRPPTPIRGKTSSSRPSVDQTRCTRRRKQ